MTQTILIAVATLLSAGVGLWCAVRCVRGMRHGGAGSRGCPPSASPADQLAELRHELAEIKAARSKTAVR